MYMIITCLFLTVSAPNLSSNEPPPIIQEDPVTDQDEEIILETLEEPEDPTIKNCLIILVFGVGSLLGGQYALIFTKHFAK